MEKSLLSPVSVNSEDYQFLSLSQLERQTLLDQDDRYSYEFSPPPSPLTQVQRSTPFLDDLRGDAALLVYLHHFTPTFYGEQQHRGFGQKDTITGETWYYFASVPIIRLFYTGGDAAVAIFFVLSGYVLTISPLTTKINRTACEGVGSPHTC